MTQDLPRLLLAALAASDALAPLAMSALHEDGLVDAFHEPYIASRYQITRKGRDSLG